jgi:hypothetical protein
LQMTLENGMSLTSNAVGTVVLAGFTCNLSIVNGIAFVTNPSVRLDGFIGRKLTFTAGGKTLVGWAKSAGSGETYGAELITSWVNAGGPGYDTFTTNGKDITSAIKTGGAGNTYTWANYPTWWPTITGELHKTIITLTLNSGTAPTIWQIRGDQSVYDNSQVMVNGANTIYRTETAGGSAASFYLVNGAANGNWSAITTSKKVLTPSVTGVTIVSTLNGSTYNWTSNDGIDPNAAFTLTVSLT